MEQGLAEFLRERKAQATNPDIDWQAKKDNWIRSVEHLYQLVVGLLKEAIDANSVTVRESSVNIAEQFVGDYSIPRLELIVGYERIEFLPKGMTVIGVAGRVDIIGAGSTVSLVRDSEDIESSWSVIMQRVPFLRWVPLDQDSLRSALEKVMLPST